MKGVSVLVCLLISITCTLGQFGSQFGICQITLCRTQNSRADRCCRSGQNIGCCAYTGGNNGFNNGGNWGNGINNGGNWGNGNYNNNKPGQCPRYNGRRRRSPEQLSSSGRTFGGWINGGQGFNPG